MQIGGFGLFEADQNKTAVPLLRERNRGCVVALSELQSEAELDLTAAAVSGAADGCAGDLAEGGVAETAVGVGVLRGVGEVEAFHAELQLEPFGDGKAAEDGEVHVGKARAFEGVAADVAKGVGGGDGEDAVWSENRICLNLQGLPSFAGSR